MSYTLPWLVNKFISTNINNADSITGGAFGNVSLKVGGKTQLVGNTVVEGKLGVGGAVSSNALEVNGKINASSDISTSSNITATKLGINTAVSAYTVDVGGTIHTTGDITTDTNLNITGGINSAVSTITPITNSITISNYNFATPAQGVNNFTTYTSPYSDITGWTFTLVSGTAPSVRIGNSFTALVNNFANQYPEYPLFSQYFSIQNGAVASVFRLTQNLTFATTGLYLLTMYIWGEYNRYSPTQNVSVTCGDASVSNFPTVEQGWTKLVMKFKIVTAGTNQLTINLNSSTVDSGLSISGIQIVKQAGLIVTDGTNSNTQLITTTGTYTNGSLYNTGSVSNYGSFKIFGPLALFLPYSSGSVVIGSSLYGAQNANDKGRYNVLIGQSVAGGSTSTQALYIDSCVAIGYGALEQAGTSAGGIFRCIGIGYFANRYNTTNCNDNVSIGNQAGAALGYAGGSSQRNTLIGSSVLSGGYKTGCNDNTIVGYSSMVSGDFDNPRSFNSVLGSSSLGSVISNYNSSIGYNNAAAIVNTSSNYNTFCGAQVCPTQSGATNVLLNCTFLGAKSDVSSAGSYSNSSCVGYNSRITGNNQIILGTGNEISYAMGGLNIPITKTFTLLGNINTNSQTVTPTQLGYLSPLINGIVDLSANQTIYGIKTYITAPVMSGASITATSIPDTALSTNVGLLSGAQTFSGGKTFTGGITASATQTISFGTNAPTMYGNNITGNTIPGSSIVSASIGQTQVLNGFIALANNQTAAGIKTFTSPPVMSGASISANTIAGASIVSASITQTQVSDGFLDLVNDQTILGQKTFTNAPVLSGENITSNSIKPTSIQSMYIDQSATDNNATFGSPNTTGTSNTALGVACMTGIYTAGVENTGCGVLVLNSLGTGSYNSCYGTGSFTALSGGSRNTGYGHGTGYFVVSGIRNTFIGSDSGADNFEFNRCSTLGAYSGFNAAVNDSTSIGYGVKCDASNQIKLGRTTETTLIDGSFTMVNNPIVLSGTNALVAGSTVITSVQLSYIQGLTSSAQTQLTNLSTSISNILNGTSGFTGTVGFTNATFSGTLNTVSAATFAYISGLTSSAQSQLTSLSTSITNILNGTSAFTGTVGFVNATFSGTTVTTGTATFNGILTTKGTYIKSCAPLQTTSFTISSSLIYETYPINISGTTTVTLPSASAALLGVTIRFRRVAGGAFALNSASSNIYPATLFVANATLLTASNTTSIGNSMTIVCLQLSATPTYGWFDAA